MIKLSIGSEISRISSWTVAETPFNYQSNRTTRIINSGVPRLRNISQWGLLCDINFPLTNTDLLNNAFMRYLIPTYHSHVWVGVRLKISKISISIKPHDWTSRFIQIAVYGAGVDTQITKFMRPALGPTRSCRPQMGPMLAPWTLLSKYRLNFTPWNMSHCTCYGNRLYLI